MTKRVIAVVLLGVALLLGAYAQDASGDDVDGPSGRRPHFGQDTSGIVHVEGEDAVSTNFASMPTLDYGTSAYRTLQLNRYTGLQGGAPFFATYTFYVPEAGSYEFWYAGTPPGPREDIYPSYTSPFSFSLDDGEPVALYWEDVTVTERYSPTHYWTRVGALDLEEGTHTLRIEVTEKRRYDGKFLFFLDSFFMLQDGAGAALQAFRDQSVLPRALPTDVAAAGFPEPFRSVSTYEGRINANPNETTTYYDLAYVYSLLGQYLEAIKYLNRIYLQNPEDLQAQLLMAKNRIWKQDFDRGLALYRQVLSAHPDNLDVWAEAGKVAAWIGRYDDSLRFYRDGLAQFPESLNLTVNLGLTHLWASNPEQAQERLDQAAALAEGDLRKLEELAGVYRVNGYPDRAADIYEGIVEAFPDRVNAYVTLSALYRETDRADMAEKTLARVEAEFQASERLDQILTVARLKQTVRERIIDEYERRLDEEPDNLALREELVQTFFWNGLKQRAITEYENILANQTYRYLQEMDRQSVDLLRLMSTYHLIGFFLESLEGRVDTAVQALESARAEVAAAEDALADYEAAVAQAQEAGDEPPDPGDPAPATRLELAGAAQRRAIARVEELTSLAEEVVGRFDALESEFTALLEAEQERHGAFREAAAARGWEWNRPVFLDELRSVADRDVALAAVALARVALAENRLEAAGTRLDALSGDAGDLPPTAQLLYEHRVWSGQPGEALALLNRYDGELEAYLGYAGPLRPLVVAVLPEPEEGAEGDGDAGRTDGAGAGTSGSETGAVRGGTSDPAEAVAALQAVAEEGANRQRPVRTHLLALHEALNNQLSRTIYRLQDDTRLTRFQLGNYYLEVGNRERAVNQFEQVLAVDPQNLDARYAIASVFEQQGRWRNAMEAYRAVYEVDPSFRQADARHNALARRHPDRLVTSASLLTDSSSFVSQGSVEYRRELGSLMGIVLRYGNDTKRLYKGSGATVESHYQLHSARIGLPLSFFGGQWTVEPFIGGAAASSAFGESGEQPGTVNAPFQTTTVSDLIASFEAEPRFGASTAVNIGPWYLSGRYAFGRIAETYLAVRSPAYAHTAELNGSGTWRFGGSRLFDSVSVRVTETADFVQSSVPSLQNILSATSQEATLNLHVADAPWTTVSVGQQASFQHSRTPGVSAYYAPNAVLVAYGYLGASSWFGSQATSVVGLNLRAAAGTYIDNVISSVGVNPRLYAEATARAEVQRRGAGYSLSLTATRSGSGFDVTDYWSFFAKLEMRAELPDLLAE